MNSLVYSLIGLLFGILFIVFLPVCLFRVDLLLRIMKYNKAHPEHPLDKKTSFTEYQKRLNTWLLEMFCDEKKGNNENEK